MNMALVIWWNILTGSEVVQNVPRVPNHANEPKSANQLSSHAKKAFSPDP